MSTFQTLALPANATLTAPDGSDVRVLLSTPRGSMAHFALAPGKTSAAIEHVSVEELWFVLGGQAQMWRADATHEDITLLCAGMSLSIPVGTRFQFRTVGPEPFTAVGVTMPPWPGAQEAVFVQGLWQPS